MTDKTESRETPAQRFGLVMSWLSAPIILLSTLIASVALVAFIYDGPDDDYLFLFLVALFGGMISLALAAAGYIVSGEFRFLPPLYSRRTKQALLVAPLAMPVLLVILIEIIQMPTEEKVVSASVEASTAKPAPVVAKWYEEVEVGNRKFALTNKVTDAFVILDDSPSYKEGYPDNIVVTVLYRQLIASAYWVLDCEPNKVIASKIVCSESGKSAYATFRVEGPNWQSTLPKFNNVKWKLNSSGFVVNSDFRDWPLNEIRQKDAYQLSHDIDRPSPRDVKHVMAYFRKGSELWENPKPNYFDQFDPPRIRFLDENEPGS